MTLSMPRTHLTLLAGAVAALACADPPDSSADRQTATAAAIATTRDSGTGAAPDTASLETTLARFQATLSTHPTALEGGTDSRDDLGRALVTALAASDTAALRHLAVSRAEFAHLIYPESPLVRAPYRQPIDVAWLLHSAPHAKGFTRLLRRLGGRPLRYRSMGCGAMPTRQGGNRYWTGCRITLFIAADSLEARLFTSIVERAGRFKIMSYDNDF